MADTDGYTVPVRAARAYVAGFGTSGSLLAGAAALFLVGSAIVAFNGWPQIGTRPATSNVAAAPVPVSSRASRRLIHALYATAPSVRAPGVVARSEVARGGARRSVAGRTVARGTPGIGPGSSPSGAGSSAPGAVTASLPAPVSGCSSCPHPGGSPGPLTTATNKIAQTVSTVGSDVGQRITGLSGTAAKPVSAVSRPVGNTVTTAGSTVGGAVSGTATTAANTVTTVGNALGGGH